MTKIQFTGFAIFAALLMPATTLLAAGSLPDGPYIISTGKATTEVAPDFAVITFAVQGVAPTTSVASVAIEGKVKEIFSVLKKNKIPDDDIRASILDVSPSFSYEGDKRIFRGQQVTRDFKVTLRDLRRFSNLIDGLLKANVDELTSVDFQSSKEAEIEKRNLETAINNARKQASDMAERAGEHIIRIYGMAPGEYSSFIIQDFPMQYRSYPAKLGKVEVTGSHGGGPQGYIIPKSITFSTTVTVVSSVK